MAACEKLGISRKVYALSIPVGATINMDGACVHLAVFALALAKTYGIPITGPDMAAMVVTIIVLSLGAPGIPGAGLICLSLLVTQLGIPLESIGLVMGIDALIGMFRAEKTAPATWLQARLWIKWKRPESNGPDSHIKNYKSSFSNSFASSSK